MYFKQYQAFSGCPTGGGLIGLRHRLGLVGGLKCEVVIFIYFSTNYDVNHIIVNQTY